ncbi:hypothetical protein PtA15_4A708 [Puccinia triticina]|uniref:Aconitase A/isopropylmalate dehydratase small subunit swivel domain-containing protein n=1 Tax=Puccinia triticina TaxID=208348 RepID=A0ABY7CHM1_9BASI|nr:uncharacterized protein PtA15_4A708 [Puccinia triticina]WAQ84255.1 hypothetical protein PtA15_4A708 [Puccinia triticina]
MENYDRLFAETVRHLYPSTSTGTLPAYTDKSHITRAQQSRMTETGVILVVGHKFGTGSSRKQAATALRNAGISLVISATFGEIWKRNGLGGDARSGQRGRSFLDVVWLWLKEGIVVGWERWK